MKCYRLGSGIVSVCDMPDNEINVDGRIWRFDFDRQLGPLWLKRNGTERKCQMPNKRVWAAFDHWLKEQDV